MESNSSQQQNGGLSRSSAVTMIASGGWVWFVVLEHHFEFVRVDGVRSGVSGIVGIGAKAEEGALAREVDIGCDYDGGGG
jgi:hypothetical protein